MVEITNRDEFEAWLADKPREVSAAIAARAALRALPLAARGALEPEPAADIVLPVFRATAALVAFLLGGPYLAMAALLGGTSFEQVKKAYEWLKDQYDDPD